MGSWRRVLRSLNPWRTPRQAGTVTWYWNPTRGLHDGLAHVRCLDRGRCVPHELPVDDDGHILPTYIADPAAEV